MKIFSRSLRTTRSRVGLLLLIHTTNAPFQQLETNLLSSLRLQIVTRGDPQNLHRSAVDIIPDVGFVLHGASGDQLSGREFPRGQNGAFPTRNRLKPSSTATTFSRDQPSAFAPTFEEEENPKYLHLRKTEKLDLSNRQLEWD